MCTGLDIIFNVNGWLDGKNMCHPASILYTNIECSMRKI
jgi:hypothetical protein